MADQDNITHLDDIHRENYQEGPLDAIPRLAIQALASITLLQAQFDNEIERNVTDKVISVPDVKPLTH